MLPLGSTLSWQPDEDHELKGQGKFLKPVVDIPGQHWPTLHQVALPVQGVLAGLHPSIIPGDGTDGPKEKVASVFCT